MAASSSRQFKNICVLSGFHYGKYKEFVQAPVDLGRAIAERKLHLVYGGGDRGLSKLVLEAIFIRGNQVLGIIPQALKSPGCVSDVPIGEELVVSSMQEQISEMLNHADAFIFLPGDLATLEALITFASWAHLNIHKKPIGLLNVNNFFDGLLTFINHAIKNHFIPISAKNLFVYACTANELLDLLQAYKPEPDPKTLALEWLTNDSNPSPISVIESKVSTDISRVLMADHAKSTTTDPPPREPGQPYVDIPSDFEGENEGDNSNPPPRVGTKVASGNGPWFTFDDLPQLGGFLGEPATIFATARKEYLQMRCCSMQRSDLHYHFKRMSALFHKIGGINDHTLKHVFLSSLPEELQPEIRRQIANAQLDINNLSLGRLFQLALVCFICKKLGHFAKECPKNPKRSQRLVQQLQSLHQFSPDTDQIEFLYSEQESPDPGTVFALGTSDSDSDSASSTELEDYSPVFHIRSVPSSSTQLSVQPIPSVKIQILLSKYSRPIPAIAFIDTGAQHSILNPAILPPETWISNENHFRAASGKLFSTKLRTKSRIGIQLFPKLTVWTHVIGSTLPDKDLLLGFDILFQAQKIQVLPTGLRFQSMFQPYTDQLKLYHLAQSPPDYQSISAQLLRFCPPNHLAFAHPHPLWKNPAHFVKLPFKLNEDLNPTKTTHPGMPPSELQLAQTECAELLAQGLIEPTTSQWACQAFYVNKRAETLRGTPEEHQVLLQQFHDIVDQYGIMLSDKKSTIATDTVEYLGMQIKNGFYQPGPHIAQELLHFPDKDFTKKQVQQFLGIINYIRDFLPHVDQQTTKADSPESTKTQDHDRWQTYPLDTSWGALLLEQIDKKEYLIGHASGHFSPAQQHYHTIYKEILAVKNGIKKFEYHLLGHRFLIRLDNSSFPKVLQFKGQKNLIPDFLSRIQTPASPIFYTSPVFPVFMATRSTATSLPSKALTQKTFPRPVQTFPSLYRLQEFAKQFLFRYYMKAFFLEENPHNQFLTFHPENLFLTGFFIPSVRDISDDELWYFWCLTVLHATQLIIPLAYTVNTLNDPSKATSLLWTLLEWFSPIPQWRSQLQHLSHNHHLSTIPSHEAEKFTSVFIVHRPYFRHSETAAFFAQPQISHYHTTHHPSTLDQDPMFKKALMNHLLSLNHVPPPPQDIISSSIGPRHQMFMVPNPSGSSKGIIIKEEHPNTPPQIYYQDSQDPEDDFLPLSQLLQEFQTPPQQEQGQSSRVISQSEPIITHPPSQCRSLCIPGIIHAKGCPQYDGPTYLEQCTLFCEPHGANCHKSCVNYRRFESSSSSDDYGMNLSSP
ncbi:hypothetical protein KPL71_017519 [Citrus sinensis]|uniref:Uncharacterized protein n=1 Tax=Citrus sinensis TaxID=2711 RepID=A0ACB8JR08_CITSI|nr:hypothetical protein KPL71_017519 [Citrus sinensis]